MERRLRYPTPIPLRWRWSDRPVSGPKSEAAGSTETAPRTAALPGMIHVERAALDAGGHADLLRIYGGLDSGRIILLGNAGTGKSSAAIMLLLDALAHRGGLTEPTDRSRTPVPVMLTFYGWDPAAQPLAAWAASRLADEYSFLRSPEYGRGVADALVANGRVALFLDGLDDLPEPLRPVALRALDEQATFRLVLLTRSKELADAVTEGHLAGAAALELQPVTPQEAAEYLARCRVEPAAHAWNRLIEHLGTHPGGALTQALDTPLMLSLVRDTYPPGDQLDDLFAAGQAGTREAVEDHLLDRVLPAAYAPRAGQPAPRYTLVQARIWLGYIATQMSKDHTRDLAWWHIPRWRPTTPRIVTTGLAAWLTLGFFYGLGSGLTQRLTYAFMFSLAAGPVFGRGGSEPRQWGRIRWTTLLSKREITTALALGLAVGLISGLAFGLLNHDFPYGFLLGLAAGLVFGPVSRLVYSAARTSAGPLSPIDPATSWRRDQRYGVAVGLTIGLILGLVIGLAPWLVYEVAYWHLLAVGLIGGLAYGLVYGFISSRTWPAILSFVQLRRANTGTPRMIRFLEDAHARQVLRTAGPLYQFRHARLQDRLSDPVSRQRPEH